MGSDIPWERYSRQTAFPGIGRQGQRRLRDSTVAICGCGGLGTVLVSSLARAGVGHLRVIDRDVVQSSNLQRQVLFDEQDAVEGVPKAEAARRKLARINSSVSVEAHVVDVTPANALDLTAGADLILDGTDNLETRFLINEVCVYRGQPWVYGTCAADHGLTMTIVPGQTPCLRCVMDDAMAHGPVASSETVGVLGPIVMVIASIQVCEALKILTGHVERINRDLLAIELWETSFQAMQPVSADRRGNCPVCVRREFPRLGEPHGSA